MKHNFRSAVLVLFSFSLLLHADYTVIHPEKMTLQEKTASEELKFFLEKSTGEKVTLKGEGKGIPSGKKIFLGNTAFARTKGYSTADFAPEEWCVRSSGKNNLILTGGSTRGVIYAVLEFLERELGILFADETYTHIPVRKSYQWKETLSYRGKPAFSVRGIYSYFTGNNTPRLRFMLRNRLNLFCDEAIQGPMKKYNVGPVFGSPRFCHNYYNYTKDLPKEAEDCFSLSQSGKRIRAVNPGGPGQICFSNPKTVRIFREKLHAYIEEDLKKYPLNPPTIYVIDPNDSPLRCHCKGCTATAKKYKAYSGAMVEFLNKLAKSVAGKYPHVKLMSSAYMFAVTPPEGLKIEPNVIIRLAQLGTEWGNVGIRDTMRELFHPNNTKALQILRSWAEKAPLGIWDYWILYSGKSNLPSLSVEAIARNAKLYKKLKITSIFAECEQANIASFHALRLYIGAKTMNDPEVDLQKEIRRFMDAYYAGSAKSMLAYYDLLHKTLYNSSNMAGNTPLSQREELTLDFFKKSNVLLDQAEKAAAGDPALLWRIRRERVSLDYGYLERFPYFHKKDPAQREKVIVRFRNNFKGNCVPSVLSKGGIAQQMKFLHNYLQGLSVSVPLPAQFRKKQIIADFTWPKLSRKSNSAKLTDDPQAAGGKCIRITRKKNGTTVPLGAYALMAKKHLIQRTNKNIKPDGKYHFYSTGPFVMQERSFIWTHWSWNIQADLTEFYDRSGLNNKVEAFVSVKITDDKEFPYSVDRIIVVKVP